MKYKSTLSFIYFPREKRFCCCHWNFFHSNWLNNFRTSTIFFVMFLKGFFRFFGAFYNFFPKCRILEGTTKSVFLYIDIKAGANSWLCLLVRLSRLVKRTECFEIEKKSWIKDWRILNSIHRLLPRVLFRFKLFSAFDFSSPYLIDESWNRREREKGFRDDAHFWTYFTIFFQVL